MAEVSEADQVKIATGFLMNAPAGEFMEVVTDLRSLLPHESMLNDTASETFKNYNQDQLIQVDAPSEAGHRFLISKHGEVAPGSNQYLDSATSKVHTFDHIKGVVTSTRAFEPGKDSDSATESLRAAIEKAASAYVSDQFPFGSCGVYAPVSEPGTVYVCICSTKLNAQNFCNGRWRSVWTINKSGITGRIKLQAHYFEDGNVQLHTDTTKKLPFPGNDAAAIVKAIVKAEQSFQTSLDASYGLMNETTLKALRRPLPISGQKINWTLIQSYKLMDGAPALPK